MLVMTCHIYKKDLSQQFNLLKSLNSSVTKVHNLNYSKFDFSDFKMLVLIALDI